MAPRACLPGELYLDAIRVYPPRQLDLLSGQQPDPRQWVTSVPFDDATRSRAEQRGEYIALHWVLNPVLGIPLEPFTVWRRPVPLREAATPIVGWRPTGLNTFGWDGITELLHIEIDVSASTTARGLGRADNGSVAQAAVAGPGTIVLEGGPMLSVRVDNPGAVIAARGVSTVRMANGAGWKPIEMVGLPFGPPLAGTTYYANTPQGPTGASTDPVSAAIQRLKTWGPVMGWGALAGLPAWTAPDPAALVDELQGDVLGGLTDVLQKAPPPNVAQQQTIQVLHKLDEIRQWVSLKTVKLNQAGDNQRSEMRTRPLQALTTAVASDVWLSLALGFATGADPRATEHPGSDDDFMVTAPWSGLIAAAVAQPTAWPWLSPPEPRLISQRVDRELAAVVLAPRVRPSPGAPTPVLPTVAYAEGAPDVDQPYRCAVSLRTSRPSVAPNMPRVAAIGMARYDSPGVGHYAMRQHVRAGGWVPVATARAINPPGQRPDPELVPDTIMLRDNGVEMPISGPARGYAYAIAATDVFGQWSRWSTGWLAVGPADVQPARVSVLRAQATPGPGGADPCALAVTAEIVWDRRERTCSRMHVVVDVADPAPPPPAPLNNPPDAPTPPDTRADVIVQFDPTGSPVAPFPASVTLVELHEDDTPVTPAAPATSTDRRYRITFTSIAITYAAAREKAVALYVQSEETLRPGAWSAWSHAREYALAANPLPPPVPTPLPAVYPLWASLPDAAGLSYAPVSWMPTGAWRYRVYEATETALLAACGRPAPVLTNGYGGRMQALFDLYRDPANRDRLKSVYRKLGDEPIIPAVQPDGSMRFESLLPRGSRLIHCYIVAGVSETNVVSSWPVADADGRRGFTAYAIPVPLHPDPPEIIARLPASGVPEITVRAGGGVPATQIRLYRTSRPVLARSVNTMDLVSTVATDPVAWRETVIADPTAPTSWSRLQYRAVALTADDPDRAQMAVGSLPSRSYALLNPPPGPPSLAIAPNVPGSTDTRAIVRVDTTAPRTTTDVGDHVLAWVISRPSAVPVRSFSALGRLPLFPTLAALAASTEVAAYVGPDTAPGLFLAVERAVGESPSLTLDLTDPLGRQAHLVADVPAWAADPVPTLTNLNLVRAAGVVTLSVRTNIPQPPDPARDWTLDVIMRRVIPPLTVRTMSFSVASITAYDDVSDLPDPDILPAPAAIGRVGTQVLMWVRSPVALRVVVRLTNSVGQAAQIQGVSP